MKLKNDTRIKGRAMSVIFMVRKKNSVDFNGIGFVYK